MHGDSLWKDQVCRKFNNLKFKSINNMVTCNNLYYWAVLLLQFNQLDGET